MNEEAQEHEYSDDETLKKAIELLLNGYTDEEVRKKLNLSDNDMNVIDFVINEF